MAGAYMLSAGGALVAQIEQGPAGIRFLCFLGSASDRIQPFWAVLERFWSDFRLCLHGERGVEAPHHQPSLLALESDSGCHLRLPAGR